ncbi:MAG: cysteine--tRNA ligase [Anaerolineales bacterium]
MALKIYNTLTRRTEAFEPLQPGMVSIYVCGPTVYDSAHIGHAMSSLAFDIVRRYLEYRGYEVRHAMNYTDVDDKIIQRANTTGEDPIALAERYIEEYDRHLKALNILPATIFPRATGEIASIIDMVARLLETDYAYVVDGDVYYRIEKKSDYGKLSGRKLEEMNAGARVAVDDRKEHPMDFALWKTAKEGEPSWDSPWGKGRPGWHIECSAMVFHHLGQQIDIHGGGNDLIFPHHENEIAQSESLSGKPFARYWMHNGMMQLSGEKMSKSLGNLITITEFLENHEGDVLRMMVLNSSYRRPLTYGDDVVEAATRGLERLRSGLRPALPGAKVERDNKIKDQSAIAGSTREGFIVSMDDDFNSSAALAHLFELVRQINQSRDAGATDEQLKPAQDVLRELMGVFGLRSATAEKEIDTTAIIHLFEKLRSELDGQGAAEIQWPSVGGSDGNLAQLIDILVEVRDKIRAKKLWGLSDMVRDRLKGLGILVEDSARGSSWRWA